MDRHGFVKNNIIGSEYWVNSGTKTFSELCEDNFMLFPQWKYSNYLIDSEHYSKVLKPINKYVSMFWQKPEIMLNSMGITLRYKTHAEIWVEEKENGVYAVDKVWQRQFYPSFSTTKIKEPDFNAMYRFYIPWIIDGHLSCEVEEPEGSAFSLYTRDIGFEPINVDHRIWQTGFIDFSIKRFGSHMRKYNDDIFGIIDIGTPTFDLKIKDTAIVDRILSER